jgi:RNA-directed DNA polymerase
MTTAAEILKQARAGKGLLHAYFVGNASHPGASLQSFKKHELNALYFLSVENPHEFTCFLKTSFPVLEEIINNPCYENYSIPKKRGGLRQISKPDNALMAIQKRLNYYLQAYYLWIKPYEVHGFVVNPCYFGFQCNIVENARVHVGKKHVLNIDLKDFFSNITARRVKALFSSDIFDFPEQLATALTLLTTYEGRLPTGAPTSPVISNFVCQQLDADLSNFCKQSNLAFTRYADDLTFSSDDAISDDEILDLINLIRENRFEINEKKIRLKSFNQKQTVTGLTVNEKVNVSRKLLRKIRAMLHDLAVNGEETAVQRHFGYSIVQKQHITEFRNRLSGYINFVGMVRGRNDSIYLKFKFELEQLSSQTA